MDFLRDNIATRIVLIEKTPTEIEIDNLEVLIGEFNLWWYCSFVGRVFRVRNCSYADLTKMNIHFLNSILLKNTLSELYVVIEDGMGYGGNIILKEHCTIK